MSKQIDETILAIYQPKKLLGSGAYGHVWRVMDKNTKKFYALKKIFDAFQNTTDAQRTYRQLNLLWQLDHPNIITLQRAMKAKNNKDLYLVFELVEADLHSLIGQNVLETLHIKFICFQILKSLKYLHSGQVIHRDLKPSNILIDTQCKIKICDFGLARTLTRQQQQQMILTQQVATRWYRSPEMLLGSCYYDKQTDIWSVGCIIAQILLGKPIFAGSSTLQQLQFILQFTGIPSKQCIDSLKSQSAQTLINQVNVKRKPIKQYFKGCDMQLVNLITRMLVFTPQKRISIQEALRLPIFDDFLEKDQEDSICLKFIVPPIDDNSKLTVTQYRKLIYQDIQRRYPEHLLSKVSSSNTIKHQRQSKSFHQSNNKLKSNIVKQQPRQKSLIVLPYSPQSQYKKIVSKAKQEQKSQLQPAKLQKLKKMPSKKLLVKKKSTNLISFTK